MSDEILYNSPALHALKRHQLVSLSKRYGLKASGKNVDMVERLKQHAATLTPTKTMTIPLPAPTPAPLSDFAINNGYSPDMSPSGSPRRRSPFNTLSDEERAKRLSKVSDTWEVLSESGASLISPAKKGMTKSDSVRSWKSANNGESLSEFGGHSRPSRSRGSSIRALASSLSRRASHHIKSRSTSASSQLNKMAEPEPCPTDVAKSPEPAQEGQETVEDRSMCPPSPASTVGIPRRYSRISLLERPSTIRLCSPTPASTPTVKLNAASGGKDLDDLPFFGPSGQVKERRSMAPLRQSTMASSGAESTHLARKSMPAISTFPHSSAASIYPPLPPIGTAVTSNESIPPVPPIPGAFRTEPSPVKPFPFSMSSEAFGISNNAVVAEFEAKWKARGISAPFREELLKGRQADVRKLVNVNDRLGEGGWGLKGQASTSSIADRYAQAHKREFARMKGIDGSRMPSQSSLFTNASMLPTVSAATRVAEPLAPVTPGKRKLSSAALNTPSAPNGLPLISEGTQPKRRKMSIGPHTLDSLRDAGRSLVSLLGEGNKTVPTPRRLKRRSSGRGLVSRFGLFKHKKQDSLSQTTGSSVARAQKIRPSAAPSLAISTRTTATTATSAQSFASMGTRQTKERGRSTSAQTVASTASKTPTRPRLPDFGVAASQTGSIGAAGTPTPFDSVNSTTSVLSTKKKSQADLIRSARPAPAPPATTAPATWLASSAAKPGPPGGRSASGSSKLSAASSIDQSKVQSRPVSRLYQPTASSLARMQATIKPPSERTLAAAPAPRPLVTTMPFGNATSRFNADFNSAAPEPLTSSSKPLKSALKTVSKPALKPIPGSPMRTPGKTTSSAGARMRHKQSGLSAVKSKGNLRAESEVNARRAEIRARQARLAEEKELRAMLGEPMSGDVSQRGAEA